MKLRNLAFAAALSCGLVLTGCGSREIQSISETELFKIPYGNFEEELSVQDLNQVGDIRFGIAMQDGFFYIVDGNAKKIMELNSYGDLLTLFYNEDSETAKLLANSALPDKSVHHEISYPFDYSGRLAVDTNKNIYTVCTVPRDRQEQNEEASLLYCQTVLRIMRDGSSVEYIGQQGPGGTPFSFIKNIYTTEKNELVVVATSSEGLLVYWFGTDGFLKYMVPVTKKNLPAASNNNSDSEKYLAIENVIPDFSSYKLYVQVDYYSTYVDEESKVQSGINFDQSVLYELNIESEKYENPISIPPYEVSVVSDYSRLVYKVPYDFMGVTKSGWKFFIVRNDDGYNIQMMQNENQRILRRHFSANHGNILFDTTSLSREGILTALYFEKENVRAVWYRTDNLIDAIVKK